MRARNKELERQLQRLISHAKNNQQIGEQLHQWSCRMLAEPSADQLSGHIIRSLTEVFDLDSIAIRTWGVLESEHDDVNDESTGFISGLNQPYCGPASSQPVLGWLSEPVGSVAIVPLTVLSDCAGAIVMGSHQSDRFTEDMEIDFLVMIGELCASALSRVPLSPELEA
ncbi:DUF484 family protein [Paenalcaligenes niemegkensis]|uniref:DUF484 family protein n=1 Tax=Paenalcaligenes niemegkensis TaxID=2895469 RepID=UPI002151B5FD|nr:DUF484 family protein [Paenalcaligenes niemegkensis]MCQ9617481.1 DUF484 family protein [Paenalcaligenes niemegkensis]